MDWKWLSDHILRFKKIEGEKGIPMRWPLQPLNESGDTERVELIPSEINNVVDNQEFWLCFED